MKKIIILGISTLVLFSCGKEAKEVTNNEPVIKVVVNGSSANNTEFITASGKTEAESSANLSTRMMGYVTKVHVKTGQKVAAGQLLVSINSSDLQAKKAQVEASILQATAGYNNAKKDYDRFVNLFAQQSASQKELDDIYDFLELPRFTHNFNNVKKIEQEYLPSAGLPANLHDVRSKVEKIALDPKLVLTPHTLKKYSGLEFWRK